MITNKENILSLIPQRPPFVMIDELVHSDEQATRTRFQVREDNIFLDHGELAAPALVENIAQTAAARAGHISESLSQPVMVGYIGAIKDLEIFKLPKLNDNLDTEILIQNQVFDVTMVTGTVRCNDVLLAKCEMKIFIIKPIEN